MLRPPPHGVACVRMIQPMLAGFALFASSAHAGDFVCLPSAAAVTHEQPGAWPSWTLRVPGHEGTECWYASARATAHDHRIATMSSSNAATESVQSPDITNGFAARSQSDATRLPLPKPSSLIGDTRAAAPLTDAAAMEAASEKDGAAAVVSIRSFDRSQATGPASDEPLPISAYADETGMTPWRDTVRPLRPIITEALPVRNDPLPTREVLAAFFGALVLSSIIAGLIFRSARKVRVQSGIGAREAQLY
jgi:hypothetical protein